MRIAILGAGAMGILFGGCLSQENQTWLVDVNQERVKTITDKGVKIREMDGTDRLFYPGAVTDTADLPQMDLVIIFVKAMFTREALEANRNLIGPDTYLMTLQNGAGHEKQLLAFVDRSHVIIGSTQHNSSVLADGYVNHGGGGRTSIGLLGGSGSCLQKIADTFTTCGFDCVISDQVQYQIWDKLFLNTAASSLTAILQVPLGFILEDSYACEIMEKLAREAVAVANAMGMRDFQAERVIEDIKNVLSHSRGGYTSIYADIKNGLHTEVDTISGSVVEAAKEVQIPVPCHELVVSLIHAMEDKEKLVGKGQSS